MRLVQFTHVQVYSAAYVTGTQTLPDIIVAISGSDTYTN